MRKITLPGVSLLCVVSGNSWAVNDPQDIRIGGFEFTPTLIVRESYDDNYRGLSDNEQASWVTGINPTFLLGTGNRNSEYELEYSFNSDIFHSDSEASNTDHHLNLRSVMEFNSRNRLSWGLGYHRVEETADTEDVTENDKYSSAIARAAYRFGAQTARNQLEFGTHYERRRYHNSGNLNASEERDSLMFNSIWFHRLGARTRSLVEVRHTDHDYKLSSALRDSTNMALLGGATWDATAKTSGSFKVGAERKDFDSNQRKDFTSPMWEANATWKPRSYSAFKLTSRRAFDEGDDGASTINDWTTLASWEHDWTSRIATELNYRFSDREYEGINRDDERTSYGAGVIWSPDRWIDVKLSYLRTENDSSLSSESYDRNVYLLSFDLSL
ncbi:outer membrane beta-barrel protein [Stutzerimonas zhaodongensis]|uniref:outer membrane beta-barrel protein n=1 Tax=Stutzerimonas zhaodongensis TaxID=1176257 RepID=UPI0021058BF5|nr:outer membrane beta-barrel protein [Stutzerimonas zhaodongensis]MCQ2028720.1 outer membrane beta-barrel protein [Stutzerimonas zhaodongensis]